MSEVYWRAKTIIGKGEVKIMDNTPGHLHFQVKQRSGVWTDVFYSLNKKSGQQEWSCNAVSKNKRTGKEYGCVFNKHSDKTKPYCSHTKACEMLIGK